MRNTPFLYRSSTSRILYQQNNKFEYWTCIGLLRFSYEMRKENLKLLNKKIQKENLNSETCPSVYYHSVRGLQWTSFYPRFTLKS